MTHYNVGADHSGKDDQGCIDAVCKVLEDAGHTTTKLGVTPNLEGRMRTGNKDDVGVYIVNGVCLGTILSCNEMVQAGGCDHVIFGLPAPIMASPFNKREALTDESKKLHLVRDGSNWKQEWYALEGKYTVDGIFSELDGVEYAFGETCEEVGKAILNGNGESGSSTTTTNSGSIMSGWESITDLLKPLDGEAMVVVRGDTVIVKRIYPPEATRLWAYEGINIVDDSVKISDYSPEIYNTFTIKWGANFENELEATFEKHKELFGERRTEVNAVYEVPVDSASEEEEASGEDASKQEEDGTGTDDSLFGFVSNFFVDEETKKQQEELKKQAENTETSTEGTETKEIPITDEAEAYLFALKQVGKARRKDGHKIECKVIGNKLFEVGEWCRVYLPSFNEDSIMFISKVSHDSGADDEWLTSLTLVDYPPSLGSGQSNSPSSGNSMDEMTSEEDETSSEDESSDDSSESGDDSSGTEGGTN